MRALSLGQPLNDDNTQQWIKDCLYEIERASLELTGVATAISTGTLRERLTAARSYYVRTDGSDTNSGLSNTAGGAFLTLQRAVDTVVTLDLGIFDVTIHAAAGTYTGGVIVSGPWLGSGTVAIVGDVTTPSNCVISTTSADGIFVTGIASQIDVSGFRFTTTTSGNALYAFNGGLIRVVGKCEFVNIVAASAVMRAESGGSISISATAISLSGTLGFTLFGAFGGVIENTQPMTFTWLANTTSTILAYVTTQGRVAIVLATFTLGAFGNTGQRYNVGSLGYINTGGGGINYFPGTIAGAGTNPGVTPWGLYQ